MLGIMREPIAAASAAPEPVIPAKNMLATMVMWASPPRRFPTKASDNSTSRRVIPPKDINCPASMKKGMARRGKESRPLNIR